MRVRAWARSMWRKERLKPRTPVRAPTPTATATMTKRKRVRAARISRQAMRMAEDQGSWGSGVIGYLGDCSKMGLGSFGNSSVGGVGSTLRRGDSHIFLLECG